MENPSIIFNLKYYTAKDTSSANNFYRCKAGRNIIEYLSRETANDNLSAQDRELIRAYVELTNKKEKDILDYEHHRKGSQGMFTPNGVIKTKDELNELKKKLSSTNSTLWSGVVSFSQDFGPNFLTSSEEGLDIIQQHLKTLLKDSQLDIDNVDFSGAVHTNTAHHHIHLLFWEKEPTNIDSKGNPCFAKKSSLPNDNITLFKSSILKDINENKMDYFSLRDTIRLGAVNAMKNNKSLFEHFASNSEDILKAGHFQYARLTKVQQRRVDQLVQQALSLDKNVEAQYYEYKNKLQASQLDYTALILKNGGQTVPKNVENFYSSRINELHKRIGNNFLQRLKYYKRQKEKEAAKKNLDKKKQAASRSRAGRNNTNAYSAVGKQIGRNLTTIATTLLNDFLTSARGDIITHQESLEQFKQEKIARGESVIYEKD